MKKISGDLIIFLFTLTALSVFLFRQPLKTVLAAPPVTTINAANVSAGQFGANTGNGVFSFPGQVGIGVTSLYSPSLSLEVINSAAIDQSLIVKHGIYDYGDFDITAPAGSFSRWRLRNWENIGFQLFQVYDYSNGLVNLPRLTVDGTGNVGIGTTAPGEKLEVNGGIRLNSTASAPTCGPAKRGVLWFTNGASGVKDSLQVCAKDASDSYSWRTLY